MAHRFEKGHPKYGGKKKGSRTGPGAVIEALKERNFDPIQRYLDSIEANCPSIQGDMIMKMWPYIYPRVEVEKNLNFNDIIEVLMMLVKAKNEGKLTESMDVGGRIIEGIPTETKSIE